VIFAIYGDWHVSSAIAEEPAIRKTPTAAAEMQRLSLELDSGMVFLLFLVIESSMYDHHRILPKPALAARMEISWRNSGFQG
jgi:hypothetical protein